MAGTADFYEPIDGTFDAGKARMIQLAAEYSDTTTPTGPPIPGEDMSEFLSRNTISDDEHRERMEIAGYPCPCERCLDSNGNRIPSQHARQKQRIDDMIAVEVFIGGRDANGRWR